MSTRERGIGGPVLALCLGPTCARTYGADPGSYPEVLREAVRGSSRAVLVTTGCLGRCASSAVAVVAHSALDGPSTGPSVWLSGVHEPARCAALAAWVSDGGPAASGHPDTTLPATLVPAADGVGPPFQLLPGRG